MIDHLIYGEISFASFFGYLTKGSAMQTEQWASRGVPWQERRWDVARRGLDDLLAMAQRYHSEGQIWQAADLYWKLSEEHPRQPQSIEAEEGLLRLAETYERDGSHHMARAIFERLSALT